MCILNKIIQQGRFDVSTLQLFNFVERLYIIHTYPFLRLFIRKPEVRVFLLFQICRTYTKYASSVWKFLRVERKNISVFSQGS